MLTNPPTIPPLIPSMSQLAYGIYRFISNHPLFIRPIVQHPITGAFIPISQYNFQRGVPLRSGLTCSIVSGFHHTTFDGSLPSPRSVDASIIYKDYDLGRSTQEAIYHFFIEYTYNEVNIAGQNSSTNPYYTQVPSDAAIQFSDLPMTSTSTRSTNLSLNPPFEILSNYLELTRLALYDRVHLGSYPLNPIDPTQFRGMDVVHCNYSTGTWSKGANAVFNQGHILFRVNAFIDMGWRDKLAPVIKDIYATMGTDDGTHYNSETFDTADNPLTPP